MSKEVIAAIITAIATIIGALISSNTFTDTTTFQLLIPGLLIFSGLVIGLLCILIATDHISLHSNQPPENVFSRGLDLTFDSTIATTIVLAIVSCVTLGSAILLNVAPPAKVIKLDCPQPPELSEIFKQKAASGWDGPGFHIEPLPSEELIEGLRGSYYIVDIRSAINQQLWNFQNKEYTIDQFDRAFGSSLVSFGRNIIDPVRQVGECRLFVRGEADQDLHNDFKRDLLPFPYNFQSINFVPNLHSPDLYGGQPRSKTIRSHYTNEDLPLLRAKFLAEKLRISLYDLPELEILEGRVNQIHSPSVRKATVYLFVNWEKD